MSQLPSFQEMRSDWHPGSGPTADQAKAVALSRTLIRQAKNMLDQAAD